MNCCLRLGYRQSRDMYVTGQGQLLIQVHENTRVFLESYLYDYRKIIFFVLYIFKDFFVVTLSETDIN